jgi:hypothetical protein
MFLIGLGVSEVSESMFLIGLGVSEVPETIFLIGLGVSEVSERKKASDLRLSQPRNSIFITCLRVLGGCGVARPCGARSGKMNFARQNWA